MTEAEMKLTWCPVARVETRGPAGLTTCIGAACAWWRWDREGWALDFDAAGPFKLRKTAEAQGFCGAAGKP